ncbi:hypothetical protein LCGC14_1284590 [marine sediment metagenome]|uniref:Uncharacterized protein n=1 Tax=marine sediment metagenome TaxID=412755 RepID=A0A0F9NXC4_9ZZZZ
MRKVHSKELGYIAERMNPHIGGSKVVIYVAGKQDMDVGSNKYAVFCDGHNTLVGTTSIPKARILMKQPEQFCDSCRNLI